MRLPRLPAWAPWAAAGALLGAIILRAVKPPSGGGGSGGGFWGPADPFGGKPVDPYAPQQTNHPGACDPVAKEGVKLFRRWAIDTWGERPGSPENIVRACSAGTSEHEQGRAWDMMTNSIEHGQSVIDTLTAPDPITGEPDALMRRAGVMYAIWDHQMWRSYPHGGLPSGSWAPYTGGEAASPHTDHIHFSFSIDGADGLTSLYDAILAGAPIV